MMLKKAILLSLCLSVVVSFCILPAAARAQTKNVSLWTHTSGTSGLLDVYKDIIAEFNQNHQDITVELVELPSGSYTDQVNAAALSGDLPCILDFDGPNLYNFAWSGYLLPLDQYVSEEMKNDFLPSIIKQGTYNGKLYSLGNFDSGLGLWANKAYLEQAGVRIPSSVEDAWTLEEFEDALAKLKALPEVDYPLDLKMNYSGEWFTYGFSPILQSFGADLIDRSDYQSAEGVLNGPEAVKAMEWVQSLFERGYANPEPAGDDSFYGTKTAALSAIGHWGWRNNQKGLGDDLILLPMPKFGPKHVSGMGSWNWGLTANCPHPDAAWKFLEHILSSENTLKIASYTGAPPARKSAIAESELYGPGGKLSIFAEQLQKIAVERPATPAYPVITDAFAEALQNIVAGEDVKEQLDIAVQAIDRDIEDNEGYPVLE